MTIAVYGGTFNPPHLGHLKVVETISEKLNPDRIMIIPDNMPPHKGMEEGAPSAEDRLEMCKLTFSCIKNSEISDIEIKRGGKSYTSDTIREIKIIEPEADIYLVIGSDMLLSFKTWHEYKYILDNCKLAVVTRTGTDIDDLDDALLKNSFIIPHEPVVISSSEIRDNVEAKKEYLSEEVYDFIHDKGIYK